MPIRIDSDYTANKKQIRAIFSWITAKKFRMIIIVILLGASGFLIYTRKPKTETEQKQTKVELDSSGAQRAFQAYSSYLAAQNSVRATEISYWTLQSKERSASGHRDSCLRSWENFSETKDYSLRSVSIKLYNILINENFNRRG